jgi:pyruvate kinase
MSLSQTKVTVSGPELRGANITLEKVMAKTETEKRQSKIVCTLGPACWDVPQLEELVEAGLAVARFNFSHGDHEGHKACLDRMREAASNKGKHVGTYCKRYCRCRFAGRKNKNRVPHGYLTDGRTNLL